MHTAVRGRAPVERGRGAALTGDDQETTRTGWGLRPSINSRTAHTDFHIVFDSVINQIQKMNKSDSNLLRQLSSESFVRISTHQTAMPGKLMCVALQRKLRGETIAPSGR